MGEIPAPGGVSINELWNGSAWTETTDMNQARFSGAGVGTHTAALSLDGNPSKPTSYVEQWNGSTWTEIADLTTGVDNREGAGTVTSALGFGGYVNPGIPTTGYQKSLI